MFLKIALLVSLFIGARVIYSSLITRRPINETPPDSTWWNGLTDEWKTIFLINQTLEQNGIDIYEIQNEYINRRNKAGAPPLSELNTSLYDLTEAKEFGLSYTDFYNRVLRTRSIVKRDTIDLAALSRLETLYIVNSPGDLSPLRKITGLKTLILNFGGMPYGVPLMQQMLSLEPIKNLISLQTLHCTSCPIQSLEHISNLTNLEELSISNTKITSLSPLKNLTKLKRLSFGSSVKSVSSIKHLTNLEELYLRGCKDVSGLSSLAHLTKLSIAENELAIVNDAYRIKDISFLSNLKSLQFIDLNSTSYKGSLAILGNLPSLRAVTLPPVKSTDVEALRKTKPDCIIINGYEFER